MPGDRTADAPNTNTPDENKKAAGLTPQAEKNLMAVMKTFSQKYSYNHRGNILRVSKVFEYIRDRQYVYWDNFSGRYIDPFDEQNSQQGKGDDLGYRYVNNVIQWLLKVFQATLSPSIPKTRFWPNDAENDQDVLSAEAASKAQSDIERKNNVNSLLLQELMYLFAAGNYFKYTRWVRDGDRVGYSKEPVWTIEDEEVKSARYICQRCGYEMPEAQAATQNSLTCPQCGSKLDEGDFHEPVSMPVPKIVAMNEVPNGQVCFSIYNTMHVMVSPDAVDPSVDPLNSTPILKLDDETDISTIRAAYPKAWDLLKTGGNTSNASNEQDYARIARTRNFTSTPGRQGTMNEGRPTLTRCWMRTSAFNILDKKEDAEELARLFPDGVKLVCVGETFLEAVPEKLTDHWTWCGTMKGFGAYPPAIADPAIPFQDRINDAANNAASYYERLASPDVLANTDLIDVEAWNGQPMSGGGFKPVKPKKNGAMDLTKAFFQPVFHIDGSLHQYADVLMTTLQLLTGLVPQTWGGHQEGIDTASGQEQALNTATGILGIYWKLITEEHANSAKRAVKILAKESTDDINSVTTDEDDESKFKNDTIKIDELQGEFNCYPDVDQGIPITAAEWRSRLEKIMLGATKNPLIEELFMPMENRVLAMKAWAPAGMTVPGKDTWNAVMQDIGILVQSGPLPPAPVDTPMGPQMVQMPSVLPEKDLYDLDIAIQAWKTYGLKKWHSELAQNPAGRENFLLYGKMLSQYQAEKQAPPMGALPPGAPPPQGAQA